MKLSSFNNRIAYSPIVTDLGHGRYGLRGLSDGDGDARARSAASRTAAADEPRPDDLTVAAARATSPRFRPPRRR